MPIQRQIGHQTLEASVLIAQFPQLPYLKDAHARVPLLPDVVHRLADPHLRADIRDRLAGIPLLQGKQDLLLCELGLFYRFRSLP